MSAASSDAAQWRLTTAIENIPAEIKTLRQWVLAKTGKAGSPINPRGYVAAKVSDPATWGSFEECCAARCDGFPLLGFVFTSADPYVGVDLDACIDPETNDLNDEARAIVDSIDSYTEISPRGSGVHLLVRANIARAYKRAGMEIYQSGRYFRMTGCHYPGTPLEINSRTLQVCALFPSQSHGEVAGGPIDDAPDTLVGGGGVTAIIAGERNNRMIGFAGALRRQGLGAKTMIESLMAINGDLCSPALGRSEIEAIAKSACRYRPSDLTRPLSVMLAEGFQRTAALQKHVENQEIQGWIVNAAGKLKSAQTNAEKLLEGADNWQITGDSFASRTLINGRPYDDIELFLICEWLERTKPIVWGKDHAQSAITVIANRHSRDPLRDYLLRCTAKWDGTPRVDMLLTDAFGLEQTEYHARAMRSWMIQGVARGMTTTIPGAKCDLVLLLIGAPELGKSLFFESLCPDPAWFMDSLPALDDPETPRALQGRWIVELAELASIRKSQIEATRAFLTRRTDIYRAPYARATVERPRRCIFGGTSNLLGCLPDQEGNRRFAPIIVTEKCNTEYVATARDQLWGEAAAAYAAGERWHINLGEIPELEAAREAAREQDEWEAMLDRDLVGQNETTIRECWRTLGGDRNIDMTKADQMRVAACLHNLGWRKSWIYKDDSRVRGWKRS